MKMENNERSDGATLQEAVDGLMSEFLDEYIIVGKKAGYEQKFVVSTLASRTGFLSPIYEECLKWAYEKGKYGEKKK